MMFAKKFFLLILSMLVLWLPAAKTNSCDEAQGGETNVPLGRNSNLCRDFQAIRDLAPSQAVEQLIQKHWRTDCSFRKAAKYIMSPSFNATLAIIDNSQSYRDFMHEFHQAGVRTNDIDSLAKIFECVLTPLLRKYIDWDVEEPDDEVETRSLNCLAVQIIQRIPKNEYQDLMKRRLKESKQFAKFYAIVRNADFQARFFKAMRQPPIYPAIKTLRRNQIDLSKLLKLVFNLFASGPQP